MSSIGFLHEVIRDAAERHGFKKGGSAWRASRQDTILVIEPQKSQYGDVFYINLGAYVRQLGGLDKPRAIDCHIRGRIEGVLPSEDERTIQNLLDFEDATVDEQDRHVRLVSYFGEYAVPFLDTCATLPGIHAALGSGRLRLFLVRKELNAIL